MYEGHDGEADRRGEMMRPSSRSLTWGGDAGDDGEDVHEVDEAPRFGEPAQRPGQRRHAGAALADRHVHVLGGTGGGRDGGGGGDAPRRPLVRLQLLYLPRAAAATVGVAPRQAAAGVLDAAATTGLCHASARAPLFASHLTGPSRPGEVEECEDEQELSSGRRVVPVCPAAVLTSGRHIFGLDFFLMV